MINILLTGASGFLGSYFQKKYSDKYKITTFSFRENEFSTLDVQNIDTVIHLSALVHQMGGAEAEEYERVNVTQSINLATKAKASGVKHFIFMSTVKVYGEETNRAYNEQSECKPQDDYGKSKLKAERELQKLEDDDFIVSIVRTPIVYGYGVKANIKSLIDLVKKVPLLPFAQIQNRRSMVYIGNLSHLVDVICEKREGGIFLAADDKAISTTRLIELIALNLGKNISLIRVPFFESLLKILKPSFHKRLYESLEVDNSVTQEVLEFNNLYSVEDGIRFMIDNSDDMKYNK